MIDCHCLPAGLLDEYDSPSSLPSIAPRPLLIVNGERDPRCPLPGVYQALEHAKEAYAQLSASDKLQLMVDKGVGHQQTEAMNVAIRCWFDVHLM